MIQNSADIFKISNTYILKSVFVYLDYQYILKVLKNNKKLQNKLGINIEHYKKESNYQNYQYEKKKDLNYFYNSYQPVNCCEKFLDYLMIILKFINLIYIFMYMITYSLEDFQDSLKIKNYENYSNFNKYKYTLMGIWSIINNFNFCYIFH